VLLPSYAWDIPSGKPLFAPIVENVMAVSEADVQELAQGLLGRNVAPEFLEQFTKFENPAAVYDAMYDSAEGQNFRQTGVAASLDNPGVLPTGNESDQSRMSFDDVFALYEERNDSAGKEPSVEPARVSVDQVQQIYQEELGRAGADNFVRNWSESGMTIDEIRQAINDSAEGQNYDTYGLAASLDNPGVLPTGDATVDAGGTTGQQGNFNPLIQQYYQELFNRQAQQPGLDAFSGRLTSGDLTEDNLRDAIIAGAQGTDRMYYDASQSGGPVFDATQQLFGRRPARGRFNPETGQLEGGFGQYRSQLDAGNLTPEQLRGRLVQLAYNRGEGGGQSNDYQAYLDSLGIDRSGNPFLQDGGTYANVAYGADLSQYQPDPGMPPPPPGGGGMPPMPPGFPGGGMPGKGGRIPGQYITGNQLYSGLPYGMTQPMGMMNFMQPMMQSMMQPTIYQPPQMSEQYMPNRGLMSGYSTGFGPYGGYRRPRFGGGKGGPRIMRPMGGKGGFGY